MWKHEAFGGNAINPYRGHLVTMVRDPSEKSAKQMAFVFVLLTFVRLFCFWMCFPLKKCTEASKQASTQAGGREGGREVGREGKEAGKQGRREGYSAAGFTCAAYLASIHNQPKPKPYPSPPNPVQLSTKPSQNQIKTEAMF